MDSKQNNSKRRLVWIILAPLISLAFILFVDLEKGKPEITYTLAITILMAIWWITEVIPLAVTALIPIVLFPLFGVIDGKTVSATYFNSVIFLFLGGFIIALAIQKWNLHKRIAIKILMLTGVSPGKILAGFMISTAFLSMWISNTATALMMIPIVISVIDSFDEYLSKKDSRNYSVALLLGIAYSASLGGIATLVGTPPNLAFVKIFEINYPNAPEISFGQWMIFALPISLLFLLILWFFLNSYFLKGINAGESFNKNMFRDKYKELGKMIIEERIVLYIFIVFAALLLFRSDIKLGSFVIPGWSNLLIYPKHINDGTVAIFISILLFLIPVRNKESRKHMHHLMDWETAKKIPWSIILLFGGGFALAKGFVESGLSVWIGNQISVFANLPLFVLILIIVTIMIFLTEVTSNTATTQMLLPILAALSLSLKIHPLLLMIPATLAASMAFMLPVATPPNAIIFGTNRIKISTMAKTGLVLNIIGIIIVSVTVYFWGSYIFEIDLLSFPAWAK